MPSTQGFFNSGQPIKGDGRFDPTRLIRDSDSRDRSADPTPILYDAGSQSGPAIQSSAATLTAGDNASGESLGLVVATSYVASPPAASNVSQTGSFLVTTGPLPWSYPAAALSPAGAVGSPVGSVAAAGSRSSPVGTAVSVPSPVGAPGFLGGQQTARPMDAAPPDAGRNSSYVPSGSVGGRLGSIDVTEWGYDEVPADEQPSSGQPEGEDTSGRDVSGMTPERMPPESPEGNPGSGLIDLTVAVTDPIQCFYPIAAAAGGSGSGSPGNAGTVPMSDEPLLVDLLQGRDRAFELAVADDANHAASLSQDLSGGRVSLSNAGPGLSSVAGPTLSAFGKGVPYREAAFRFSPTQRGVPASAAKQPVPTGVFMQAA